jgi:signal transduction histidine kinase
MRRPTRELSETKSLAALLRHVYERTGCMLRLLPADGEVDSVPGPATANPDCCLVRAPEDVVARSATAGRAQSAETTCPRGRKVLLIPIGSSDRNEGVLAACRAQPEDSALLASVAAMIHEYAELARAAVGEWEKLSAVLSAHEELHKQTEYLGDAQAIYRSALGVLLDYVASDAGILVPRDVDGTRWHPPVTVHGGRVSDPWLNSVATRVTAMHDSDRCPVILTPANRSQYPELDALGISSFISSTVAHEGKTLGLLVLCSSAGQDLVSFEDLTLVESLKGTIGFRLYEERMQRKEERFLQNAFHSIKTPIHSIAGIVAKLERLWAGDNPKAERSDTWLRLLHEEAQRIVRTNRQVEEHVAFSSRPRAWVSLTSVVERSVQTGRVLATDKGVEIASVVPAEPCDVHADADGLHEVLDNLIGNALRFSPPSGTIEVRLEIEPNAYRISLTDDGPGVPEHQRDAIFEAFVSIPRGGEPESSGLGLYHSRAVVEAHGGVLLCSDRPDGQGACFWFTLPRSVPDVTAQEHGG